jgi:hypothetical protein
MKNLKTNLKNRKAISFLKNKIKRTIVSCSIAFIALTSCSSNDDAIGNCDNGTWIQTVQNELTAFSKATQAYAINSTPENCNNYKSAVLAYINALDKIKTCVATVNLVDFEKALKDAKEGLNNISCTSNT